MSVICTAILASILLYCLHMVIPDVRSQVQSKKTQEHISEVIKEKIDTPELPFSHEAWIRLHEENPDFQGYLMFQSELIKEPVVQSYDNEDYLHKAFIGTYDGAGTVFMESSASLESRNITVFGHYVYYDSSSRFTPLEKLLDQQGYDNNQVVYLFLGNEVRTYLVPAIFFITEDEAEYYDYSCPDMTEEEFREWIAFINMKNMIDPIAGKADLRDRILTLQTCKKWDSSQRELVICREISRIPYPEGGEGNG